MNELKKQFSELSITNKKPRIILIQACIRGFLIRNRFKKNKDCITLDVIKKLLKFFIDYTSSIDEINNNIDTNNEFKIHKKIRRPNFPSEISENLVKFVIYKKYKILPSWNTETGDLELDLISFIKKIEVKAFSSSGPSSFGPTECWDYIYFIDAIDYINSNFKVYEIKLSNNSDIWKKLLINSNTTYYEQCIQGRRPRIQFNKIKNQLDNINENICNLIFNGNINELF